jgi:hypothetical protein
MVRRNLQEQPVVNQSPNWARSTSSSVSFHTALTQSVPLLPASQRQSFQLYRLRATAILCSNKQASFLLKTGSLSGGQLDVLDRTQSVSEGRVVDLAWGKTRSQGEQDIRGYGGWGQNVPGSIGATLDHLTEVQTRTAE